MRRQPTSSSGQRRSLFFDSTDRLYVDESKARGYYVVATASAISSVQRTEKALRSLLKPGQRRIHFKSERDSRRRELLSRMCALDVRVSVWIAKGLPDKQARPLCLTALVEEAVGANADQLLLERDQSLMRSDRQLIAGVVRQSQSSTLLYRHVDPHECPLLWISDAVAWCYSNGGDWIRRTDPIVEARVVRL